MINVLMIEDDSTIAFGVKYALEQEGFNIDICKDLESGRQNINNKEYNIILLDVMLPDGNGYEFCKEIRQTLDTPIIFLTACDEEVNIVTGLDIGGDDYITKPFRVRELISRMNAVLRRKGNNNENKKVVKFGDLSINTLEARVYKKGEEIFLTSVEYKLLLILIQNKNVVLSRTKILEKLWDVTYDFVNDNTLTVYIKRLREKIEDDSTKPKYILTVRGVGYKWDGSEKNVSI
ncbi:two-component response regulator,Sensory transduction protein regX3,DNA-binding response regulator CreB,Response regulator of citrate/malate metabolism,phosphate regulon transcriptional regulatory protein PhoB,Transcriptional regulatory protein, C terminal [[Clostridium] sordellii]|uniref:response regulator transcription factor n=1 Tax=Paraclostridium sordellii TaxID=1505 RepID=UPI000541AADA|nr:response regulator transcription factor [Paeniclostridium sordellii]CEK33928.1 two-component response regulator,Sensory transduction protein regX3,DNA-binding response regulator CreB,Response regulator of citrate/malate metabolism,phosphate regulon transcriptional regulatory protein PhoB,Transcriptional regulatory protein, C terminal [[Clostridium] sordellii] [Paeniclostridium sordellii]